MELWNQRIQKEIGIDNIAIFKVYDEEYNQ